MFAALFKDRTSYVQLYDKGVRETPPAEYLLKGKEADYALRNMQRLVITLVTRLRNGAVGSHAVLRNFFKENAYFVEAWNHLAEPLQEAAEAEERKNWNNNIRELYKSTSSLHPGRGELNGSVRDYYAHQRRLAAQDPPHEKSPP